MCGQYQDFSNLDMFGGRCSVECNVGNISSCEWGNAFVDIVRAVVVSVETYVAEVCFDQSRLEVGDTDG